MFSLVSICEWQQPVLSPKGARQMALQVAETIDSRALHDSGLIANQRSIELRFAIWDDDASVSINPVNARAALLTVLQGVDYGDPLYGLHLQDIQLEDQSLPNLQFARAMYGVQEPPQTNLLKWGLTVGTATGHITHSIATIAGYVASGTAPDFDKAINVTEDRNIQGTDIIIGDLSFWVSAWFDPSDWDASQFLVLDAMVGKWNLSSWHGWPAKYVQFLGAEAPEVTLGAATSGSPNLVSVKFMFRARAPETVDKGNGIPTFTKDPWDTVWDLCRTSTDATAHTVGKQIHATYRERVYAGGDFDLLGLGS